MRPIKIVNSIFAVAIILTAIGIVIYDLHWLWMLLVVVFFLTIHFIGVVHIQYNYFVKSYNNGDRTKKQIALTFDDGPAKNTSHILNILKDNSVPAAFFCIGKNIIGNEGILKRVDNDGHIVGNHSFEHGFMFDWQSSKKMANDILKANKSIKEVIGKEPLLFRPPYGITNPNLARAIRATSMYSIGWSLRSFDTTTDDSKKLINKILSSLNNGDVILLHDSMKVTSEILTDLIVSAKQKGFTFVRIDDLLGVKAYA